jgi:hypothetical protein
MDQGTQIGKYLTLKEFCTCTQTYCKWADKIYNPYPENPDSLVAIRYLCDVIIDPVIDHFGRENFQLTYGFCSHSLQCWLNKKDPETGLKNGRISPKHDQHMAHEIKANGTYWCDRLGAACDFRIRDVGSDAVIDWILAMRLRFDSLYFYGDERPIHISYGPQQKRAIWTFGASGVPTRQGIEKWTDQLGGFSER